MGSPEARKDLRYRSQILEAARGVPSSIVEGFRRCNPGDFRRFLDFSIASIGEAEQRLEDGIELGYFSAADCVEAFRLAKLCMTACIRLKQSQR
jgi:four helix bundle protein